MELKERQLEYLEKLYRIKSDINHKLLMKELDSLENDILKKYK
ncbi:hypothetical protein HYO65_gp099 [Tenacibaculum phage PTm1]|uniref:Uncharacterized protein n=2 Tax=Shirahamavirus PTm1 TaxID=2846435 RepID=A0A5S9HXI2_9CAUD|nr:hypothetical protein HYO65_gp099 [Tenacibaculum phage PTm1]BBI90491.1 hypothetical protein [Tenacibaculum phage PTm1]BBI90799.1 hypothetical protein [Tenacibaculum phage PTm5]